MIKNVADSNKKNDNLLSVESMAWKKVMRIVIQINKIYCIIIKNML